MEGTPTSRRSSSPVRSQASWSPAGRVDTAAQWLDHRRPVAATLLSALFALVALTGCDGTTPASNRIRGSTLSVYVSLPLIGPSRWSGEAVLNGARMALADAHGAVGHYRVVLHRSMTRPYPAAAGIRDRRPSMLVRRSRTRRRLAISATSIPARPRSRSRCSTAATCRQISPTSTAVGLTQGGLEAAPGEPQKYYPTKKRNVPTG